MARENEATVEAHLRRAVKRLGGYTMKLVPSDKGATDRLVLLPGGEVRFVELKRVGGRVSRAQMYWMERATRLGAQVDIVIGVEGVTQWERARESGCPSEKSSMVFSASELIYRG